MTREIGIVLLLFALVALFGGLFLSRYAMIRYGTDKMPKGISWNPRDWFMDRDPSYYFTEPRGHRLSLLGRTLMLIGAAISLVVFLFGPE